MKQPAHGGNLAWAAALAACPPSAILDFSASINPLGPPSSAISAIQTHISELRAYPDPDYHELRTALAQMHQLSPEWILPGNGSAELLTLAGRDFSQLAETYLLTPAFGDYRRALKAFEVNVLECPLSFVREQWSFVLSQSQGTQNKGLLLNNPHNPTGTLFQKETILPYLKQFALVVVDEAFMDFLPADRQQSLVPVVRDYPNLVILRSLTKFYSLPGLRLGYAIAHPEHLRKWKFWRDPWPVNVLAAAAGIAMVQDTEFQQKTWDWLPPARTQLFEGLAKIPGLQPHAGAANFLLVESDQPTSWLQQTLLKRKQILIRDCLSFPELGERYFRVAVRLESENQRLLEGLAEILSQKDKPEE